MNQKLKTLSERLKDERSKRILLVSHCVLNENTRYLGGAFCGGFNLDVLKEFAAMDCGIVQMPCPEQVAWGGVLKPFIWLSVNTRGKPTGLIIKLIYPLFMGYTHWVYSRIAAKTLKTVNDYILSGFEIIGIVGIDGSPTCGVKRTLEIRKSLQYFSGLSADTIECEAFNRGLYQNCLEQDSGIFMKILTKKLVKKSIQLKMYSINLQDEMNGCVRLEEIK